MQSCNPKTEPEDAVTKGKTLLGKKFVDRISSPMHSIRADDEDKTEVTFVARSTSETAFTLFVLGWVMGVKRLYLCTLNGV